MSADRKEPSPRALISAVKQHGSLKNLEGLLLAGANPDAKDTTGWSGVHWAAETGNVDALKLLCKFGADVFAPNDKNASAYHIAESRGHSATQRFLLEWCSANGYAIPDTWQELPPPPADDTPEPAKSPEGESRLDPIPTKSGRSDSKTDLKAADSDSENADDEDEGEEEKSPQRAGERGRVCDFCGAGESETPQFRQGPKNYPTLCNACGVRYRKKGTLGNPGSTGSLGGSRRGSVASVNGDGAENGGAGSGKRRNSQVRRKAESELEALPSSGGKRARRDSKLGGLQQTDKAATKEKTPTQRGRRTSSKQNLVGVGSNGEYKNGGMGGSSPDSALVSPPSSEGGILVPKNGIRTVPPTSRIRALSISRTNGKPEETWASVIANRMNGSVGSPQSAEENMGRRLSMTEQKKEGDEHRLGLSEEEVLAMQLTADSFVSLPTEEDDETESDPDTSELRRLSSSSMGPIYVDNQWKFTAPCLNMENRVCDYCKAGEGDTPRFRPGPPDYPFLCNACGVRFRKGGRRRLLSKSPVAHGEE